MVSALLKQNVQSNFALKLLDLNIFHEVFLLNQMHPAALVQC